MGEPEIETQHLTAEFSPSFQHKEILGTRAGAGAGHHVEASFT